MLKKLWKVRSLLKMKIMVIGKLMLWSGTQIHFLLSCAQKFGENFHNS
jgi:hypothetical protein